MAAVAPTAHEEKSPYQNNGGVVVTAITHGFVGPMYTIDTHRAPAHRPGKLIYSAQFDEEKLKCLYMCLTFPYCCGLDDMVKHTSFDVYTNAVVLTRPSFWYNTGDCICGRQPWGLTRYYDNTVFDSTVSDGRMCNPHICALVGWCGKFGEQLNFHNIGPNSCCPSSLGHVLVPGCCQSIELLYGFAPNEARKVQTIINDHVRIFREGNGENYGLDPIVHAALAVKKM